MNAAQRRDLIVKRLAQSDSPVSATVLAGECQVSRQIIVGDIALLRASGSDIQATPRGYLLREKEEGILRTIACNHSEEEMALELNLCADYGCTVRDVVVDHPIYGQLTGQLRISSRYDVERFLDQSRREQAAPLSFLTRGIHIHTLICPSQQAFEGLSRALEEAGLLLKEGER
ncbi:MAG: transcription repressor NadR [Oscillospiraceae bacterium]|nr:transcription repressor NadR [Oscillospiraceae bacterium]